MLAHRDSTVEVGSGFLASRDQIVTCYHVVWRSDRLEVFLPGGVRYRSGVTIDAWAPEHDLVLLRLPSTPPDRRLLSVARPFPPLQPTDELQLIGHPLGMSRQVSRGSPTSGLMSAKRFNRSFGIPAFPATTEVDLLVVDITVYDGASGAPLIFGDRVVGILSGSLHGGRGLAFAIPSSYVDELLRRPIEPRIPAGIEVWPDPLVDPDLARGLTRRMWHDRGQEAIVSEVDRLIERTRHAYSDLSERLRSVSGDLFLVEAEVAAALRSSPLRAAVRHAISRRLLELDQRLAPLNATYRRLTAIQDDREELMERLRRILNERVAEIGEREVTLSYQKLTELRDRPDGADARVDALFLQLLKVRSGLLKSGRDLDGGAGQLAARTALESAGRNVELARRLTQEALGEGFRDRTRRQLRRYRTLHEIAELFLYRPLD